jgi:radical SAM superfamily enzyme YgiQ (UPF0313 family)
MRLCLVNSPRYDGRPSRKCSVPLPLAYLAAVARQDGHHVTCIEGFAVGYPRRVAERVAAARPRVVGVTTNTNDRFATARTLRHIRQAVPDAFIVVGGHHYTHSAEDALRVLPQIDAVVVGEGEAALLELMQRLDDRDALGEVAGLVWRGPDGRLVRNPPRRLMPHLNDLPMPAWDLFDLRNYDLRMIDDDRDTMMGVMTMRGCPFRCVFCGSSRTQKVQRLAPEKAVDQLEYLQTHYGLTGFRLFDDTFVAMKRHAAAVCEEILRRDLKLNWWANSRAQRVDLDLLKLMVRAGCTTISLGVESGSDAVLEASRKGVTCAEMLEAFETVARAGFRRLNCCLMLGLPGETPETIDESIAFVKRLRHVVRDIWKAKSLIGELPLTYPGTEMEQLCYREGALPEGFSWNGPFVQPKRYLPIVNARRYKYVPHYESRRFPLEAIWEHLRRHHWHELSPSRRRRYRRLPLRRLKVAVGLM